jgi:hypothetical protein
VNPCKTPDLTITVLKAEGNRILRFSRLFNNENGAFGNTNQILASPSDLLN